jgi:hypothetical protein
VPDDENPIADAISCDNFTLARFLDPYITILSFTPLRMHWGLTLNEL